MATNTTKLALTKPDGTDLVDIAVLNANADKIDAASGATICTSTTRPASPWNGQVIFETDTLNALVYRTATSAWTTIGGSTVSATPPTTAGSGNLWWDSDNGKLYIYYSDGNSSQWVAVIPGSGANQAATNYIINSDFSINQRNFSSSTTNGGYGFDRWHMAALNGATYSAQTFTPGVVPAAGYEGKNYARIVTAAQTGVDMYTILRQAIEDVRLIAGKTVTISFWAKAASGTPRVAVELEQNFGTGGTPSAAVTVNAGQVTLSTSWARYSVTVAVPSLSGKTLGTTDNTSNTMLSLFVSAGTNYNARTGSLGIQSNTFDFWGVQVEENPQASAYKRNQPNLQAELAACQRYYIRYTGQVAGSRIAMGVQTTTTNADVMVPLPSEMRVSPSSIEYSGLQWTDAVAYSQALTSLSLNNSGGSNKTANLTMSFSANGAARYPGYISVTSTAGFLGINAEL